MPVKIRLARHGRKSKPFYHIVVADSRAPRDGKFIERIGSYNPNTNPATIDLKFDRALQWLGDGAQPTDTARSILSYKGVMYKKHLMRGVAKGALTEEQAEEQFQTWITAKEAKIQAKKDQLLANVNIAVNKRMDAERKIKNDRLAAIAKRDAVTPEEAPENEAEETATNEGEEA